MARIDTHLETLCRKRRELTTLVAGTATRTPRGAPDARRIRPIAPTPRKSPLSCRATHFPKTTT